MGTTATMWDHMGMMWESWGPCENDRDHVGRPGMMQVETMSFLPLLSVAYKDRSYKTSQKIMKIELFTPIVSCLSGLQFKM